MAKAYGEGVLIQKSNVTCNRKMKYHLIQNIEKTEI